MEHSTISQGSPHLKSSPPPAVHQTLPETEVQPSKERSPEIPTGSNTGMQLDDPTDVLSQPAHQQDFQLFPENLAIGALTERLISISASRDEIQRHHGEINRIQQEHKDTLLGLLKEQMEQTKYIFAARHVKSADPSIRDSTILDLQSSAAQISGGGPSQETDFVNHEVGAKVVKAGGNRHPPQPGQLQRMIVSQDSQIQAPLPFTPLNTVSAPKRSPPSAG
ncbi:hypothetical protein E4T38_06393 [Aureobasidium subglaciale]|nr:hypothetical protein E4T38_06393 [Aureobasidium subglaciale]KAI5219506.1 hypothetical protein E4T40_06355 [Aureobasidium subglaciale]KAI5223231.1 hypothetical protein E4T41_06195 [Aureobasidium subglaciale]KAI5259729.1 hypothetical protein E4T46_06630 [Aureobasidium subglaciale]